MSIGKSSAVGLGGATPRASRDFIQDIQVQYNLMPTGANKVSGLTALLRTAIQEKLRVSGTGSFFKSKKDEAGVVAAFRKALDSNSNADFRRDANAALDSLDSSNNSSAGGGGGGAVSNSVAATELNPPLPPIHSVDNVVGGGAAATSRSAMPQEDSYPHIPKNVNSKSPEFKACAEVISAGGSSINVLRHLKDATPEDFLEGWVQMAVFHGIPGEELLKEAVASNTDLVMTRLAATIDHIHAERELKAALRSAGGAGSAFRPYMGTRLGSFTPAGNTVRTEIEPYPYTAEHVDRNGFFMGYKRLERGKFDFPSQVAVVEMSADELSQLMAGMPMIYLGKPDNSAVVFS